MNTHTQKKAIRARKTERKENPQKLSIRARRDFFNGYEELNIVQKTHLELLLKQTANKSILEVEKAAHAARIAQANAHFMHSLWDLIVDLEKRIPTEAELEEYAGITMQVYSLTPADWNWKTELYKAFSTCRYFASVKDYFPF